MGSATKTKTDKSPAVGKHKALSKEISIQYPSNKIHAEVHKEKKRAAASELKKSENSAKKRKKISAPTKGSSAGSKPVDAEPGGAGPPHPFEWDPADDCETSLTAYRDIAPVLAKLAQKLGKTKSELRVYDPYYCQGGVARNLAKLGFTNVHNQNEDFYARLQANDLPPHDVLMTSPPYSADHIKRLLEHVSASTVPWILLLPDYVHRKQYYAPLVGGFKPFFLVPAKPYVYWSVSGPRAQNTHVACRHWARAGTCPKGDECSFSHDNSAKDTQTKSPVEQPKGVNSKPTPVTPFTSLWHLHLGTGKAAAEPVMQWWQHKFGKKSGNRMVRHVSDLPAGNGDSKKEIS